MRAHIRFLIAKFPPPDQHTTPAAGPPLHQTRRLPTAPPTATATLLLDANVDIRKAKDLLG
jgi:hypothetical protein